MPTLIGKYEYTLDPKNRLFVPPRYREHLAAEQGRHFILSIGLDRCLYLFLPSEWEKLLTASQENFQLKDKRKQRQVKRLLFSTAMETPMDDQGRILISTEHKQYAGLEKEVIVAGSGNKAELWDRTIFEAEHKPALRLFKRMSSDLDL